MWLLLGLRTMAILKRHSCAIQNIKQSRQPRAPTPLLAAWQDTVLRALHPMRVEPAVPSPTVVALAMDALALCTVNSRPNLTAPAGAIGRNWLDLVGVTATHTQVIDWHTACCFLSLLAAPPGSKASRLLCCFNLRAN